MMELESVRQNLIRMGETSASLLGLTVRGITDPNPDLLAKASELEAQTDSQHRVIRDQCLGLITRQAPVARDARMVTGVLDAIVDLELIGDYTYEIASLSSSMRRRPPSQLLVQVSEVGGRILDKLRTAIDSWRSGERAQALSVRPHESGLKADCGALYEKLSQLTSLPGDATSYVDLMLICRHLERILRHAVCVAEQAADAAPQEVAPESGRA
jgi:phosphate transport system protein